MEITDEDMEQIGPYYDDVELGRDYEGQLWKRKSKGRWEKVILEEIPHS